MAHTGEKPFECQYCEKKCDTEKGTKGHIVVKNSIISDIIVRKSSYMRVPRHTNDLTNDSIVRRASSQE